MKKTWPQIIGHRGAAAAAPENTLESIREAALQGASWVEFDAKLTRDNVVILMHDDELDRTTDHQGLVADTNYHDIAMMDGGGWFAQRWAGVRVPTLHEALVECWTHDLRPDIEIKPCPGRDVETASAVVAVVKSSWPSHLPLPLLSSFSAESLLQARRDAPDLPMMVLYEDLPADWMTLPRQLQAEGIGLDHTSLTRAQVKQLKDAGYRVTAYTVNDAARMRELLDWGVDAIFSDAPGPMLAALAPAMPAK